MSKPSSCKTWTENQAQLLAKYPMYPKLTAVTIFINSLRHIFDLLLLFFNLHQHTNHSVKQNLRVNKCMHMYLSLQQSKVNKDSSPKNNTSADFILTSRIYAYKHQDGFPKDSLWGENYVTKYLVLVAFLYNFARMSSF